VLLEHGVEVDEQDRGGNTPLLLAAKAKRLDAVELLLGYRADPRVQDREKTSVMDLQLGSSITSLIEEMQCWRIVPPRVYRRAGAAAASLLRAITSSSRYLRG